MQVETSQTLGYIASANLESLQALVVDDEPTICDSVQLFLEHLGFGMINTASNGKEALRELERERYDYVFADLMMPEMDGMEVLKIINKDHQPTSVIIMTGYPSMDVVIDAIHNGASDFLVKPFRFDDIKLALERIQRLHTLMEKNWILSKELEKKKEVESLNKELEKRIRLQTILYNIVDSLSKINRAENLYQFIVEKAIESVKSQKACFLLYDQGNSHLMALAQKGLDILEPGTPAPFNKGEDGKKVLDPQFIDKFFHKNGHSIILNDINNTMGVMTIPFNIRNEPFGVLMMEERNNGAPFDNEDEFILKFLAEKAALNIENIALYDNLKQSLMASLMSLVSAIEAKDSYTQQHSTRVTEYAIRLAEKLGCSNEDMERLETCAPLHDIGKIGVSDNILNKPGRLTQDEFKQIMTHPLVGMNIVSPLGLDSEELSIIRNHHERWDGMGYPDGLKHDRIPQVARILAVADSFDAMTSNRAYRKALPLSVCFDEIEKNSGSQFDPEIVKIALDVLSL